MNGTVPHLRGRCSKSISLRNYLETVLFRDSTKRKSIALLACIVLGCAFVAVPVVHKHAPTQQVPLQEYDASCFFVKAEKNSVRGPSQQMMVCIALLLFFTVLLPLVERRTEADIPVRSLFTRNVTPPRAPPSI